MGKSNENPSVGLKLQRVCVYYTTRPRQANNNGNWLEYDADNESFRSSRVKGTGSNWNPETAYSVWLC